MGETSCWIRAKQPLWVAPGGLQASGWQWASEAWLWLLPLSRLLQTTRAQASRPLHDKHAHSTRTGARDNRASVKCSDGAEDALWRHSDSVLGDKAEHTHDESPPLWATDFAPQTQLTCVRAGRCVVIHLAHTVRKSATRIKNAKRKMDTRSHRASATSSDGWRWTDKDLKMYLWK